MPIKSPTDILTEKFERIITFTLLIIGMLLVFYQTLYLIYEFAVTIQHSVSEGAFFPHKEGQTVGALFFNVLLTMEIIETVKVFSKDDLLKIRIILLVGLIAVTRKILLMDALHAEPVEEFATAGLLVALALGYFLVSRNKLFVKENEKE